MRRQLVGDDKAVAEMDLPVGASGDPFGQVTYRVGRDGAVSLVIDRLTP